MWRALLAIGLGFVVLVGGIQVGYFVITMTLSFGFPDWSPVGVALGFSLFAIVCGACLIWKGFQAWIKEGDKPGRAGGPADGPEKP